MIHFNVPPFVGTELKYVEKTIQNHKICGDGEFTHKCSKWFEERFHVQKVLLTTSGTAALEMAALMCNICEGDEVILPSYTFSSTATAFVLAGARLKFVDIRPDTMNIDETKIEEAITDKTKVICVMHYAGVACEMDTIMKIAHKYKLLVIEDAAQGVMSAYKGRALGTIGDFGCYSFHETKNYSMGEGGAILINHSQYNDIAEVIREKGTNRSKFYRGQVAKYNWIDYGSSYLPSDMNAAYLWGQLEVAEKINKNRIEIWEKYYESLVELKKAEIIELPYIPEECTHNAHMFFIKCRNLDTRSRFIQYMKNCDIYCPFHYVPLHSAPAGIKFGDFYGEDIYTTSESQKLVRLPLYFNLEDRDQKKIIEAVKSFFIQEV